MVRGIYRGALIQQQLSNRLVSMVAGFMQRCLLLVIHGVYHGTTIQQQLSHRLMSIIAGHM